MPRQELRRIADALDRIASPPMEAADLDSANAFVWRVSPEGLHPVFEVNRVDLSLLVGIDRAKDTLLENTRNFANGYPANNALLWGARGMGKSSLVKAVHDLVAMKQPTLKLIEIHREDIPTLDRLLDRLRAAEQLFILFCDDLSFSQDEHHYKCLKSVLDGGIEGRPANVVVYVTSNRRHLMPREMIENERSTAINPSESVEEKVSLSDRFGLWLGFHPCSQEQYLEMVRRYCAAFRFPADNRMLNTDAIEWQQTRGARSGRVAWQYVTHLGGRFGLPCRMPGAQ